MRAVGHRGRLPCWWSGGRHLVGPGIAVPYPGVRKHSASAVSSKQNHFLTTLVVRHGMRPSGRRTVGGKYLRPLPVLPHPGISQGGSAVVAAKQNYLVSRLIERHCWERPRGRGGGGER